MSSTTCCCVNWQSAVCKTSKRANSFGICSSQETECLHPALVLKARVLVQCGFQEDLLPLPGCFLQSSTQCFCIDTKMSFPPDENNPYLCNILFCTVRIHIHPRTEVPYGGNVSLYRFTVDRFVTRTGPAWLSSRKYKNWTAIRQ